MLKMVKEVPVSVAQLEVRALLYEAASLSLFCKGKVRKCILQEIGPS